MTINTTAAESQLAQVLALVNTDRVQDLHSAHDRYAAQVERLLALQAVAPLRREHDLEHANARRMAKQTRSQIEQTEKDNTAHRAEADACKPLSTRRPRSRSLSAIGSRPAPPRSRRPRD